jgi:hypothetical protein
MLIVTVVVMLIVLAFLGIVASQIDDWSRDLSTNRAATSAAAGNRLLRSLELPVSPADVRAAVQQFAAQKSAWTVAMDDGHEKLSDDDRAAGRIDAPIRLVRTSWLFGFADDVQVFLQPTEVGTLVDVVSQSRVGNGDLGQNPRNIVELMQALQKRFAPPGTHLQ